MFNWDFILESFLLFLPAFAGNAMPVLISRIKLFNGLFKAPLDAGVLFGSNRLFGENKTWGGLLAGLIAGLICAVLLFLFKYRNLF